MFEIFFWSFLNWNVFQTLAFFQLRLERINQKHNRQLTISACLAESYYNVKNRSSIITSKSLSKNFSKENKHTLCFQRIGILIHVLSWRQQKHQCLFSLLRFFDELFDVVKRLCYYPLFDPPPICISSIFVTSDGQISN